MTGPTINLAPLRKAIEALAGALHFWEIEPADRGRKPHLRAGVIQSFEFTYELAVRMLRSVLIERASSAQSVEDLSFNDLLRTAADAGLLPEPLGCRRWRDLRNRTSHSYDELQAQEIAEQARLFLVEAQQLHRQLTHALAAL